jgi:hypothetical protein
MTRHLRKRLLVDKQVQFLLIKRVLLYWACGVVFITLPIAISQTFIEPSKILGQHYIDTWRSHWPILATMTVLLPLVLFDILRVSHRFAGPIFRLRRELQRFANRQSAASVKFRDGDFWPDLGDHFTDLMERIRAAESRVAELEEQAASPVFPAVGPDVPCTDITAEV